MHFVKMHTPQQIVDIVNHYAEKTGITHAYAVAEKFEIRSSSNDNNVADEPGEELVEPRREHVVDRLNCTEQKAATANEVEHTVACTDRCRTPSKPS